jgi:hypothetical protein
VDLADDVGPRQDQQVVVALQILRMILEPLAAEVRFRQLVALDHRPHRAVEDEDAGRRARVECASAIVSEVDVDVYRPCRGPS